MDSWSNAIKQLKSHKDTFIKSYKSVYRKQYVSDETFDRHYKILIHCYEQVKILINHHKSQLTTGERIDSKKILKGYKHKIRKLLTLRNLKVKQEFDYTDEDEASEEEIITELEKNTESSNTMP